MKVKIFVDWQNETILTEKEYKERLIEALVDKENYRYYERDCLEEHIKDWLHKHHLFETLKSVFHLHENEKKEILNMCREGYEDMVEHNFAHDWEELEIEI